MENLDFSRGVTTFSLAGLCEVSFNPADTTFIERLYSTMEELRTRQDEFSKAAAEVGPSREMFELSRKHDEAVKAAIDGLFNAPVSDALFSDVSPCASADGLPIWMNLLLAVMDQVENRVGGAEERANPRINKYMEKYRKYDKKYHK